MVLADWCLVGQESADSLESSGQMYDSHLFPPDFSVVGIKDLHYTISAHLVPELM